MEIRQQLEIRFSDFVPETNSFRYYIFSKTFDTISHIFLDKQTCVLCSLPTTDFPMGGIITCTLTSEPAPQEDWFCNPLHGGDVDRKALGPDLLEIKALKQETVYSWPLSSPKAKKESRTRHSLRLSTLAGRGWRPKAPMPIPYFDFNIELSANEYEVCKTLPDSSIFKVSLTDFRELTPEDYK